jgi:hypothetical protein
LTSIELTVDFHDEDHDGYCSGAGAEFTNDYTETITVIIADDKLIWDEDGEIDLAQFASYNTCTRGCTDIERDNPQKWNPSGYCDCEYTTRVVSAKIINSISAQ